MTLTEFLLARITEDETHVQGVWQGVDPDFVWGPDRIRAVCEAHRRIVESARTSYYSPEVENSAEEALAWDVLRLLALPYAEHPEYDESWKP